MIFLLQHLLEETAKKLPDKKAVVCLDQSITYGELNIISNKLGHVFRNNDVQKGDRVGIYMDKSIYSVISIHGILKAGCTYVPIDPKAPALRLDYIIKNCGIKCLITSSKKVENIDQIFHEKSPVKVIIFVDEAAEIKKRYPAKIIYFKEVVDYKDNSPPENDSNWMDLAYILYTSGSTGNPKGVMISHLNALTFINWAYNTFKISQKDVLANHAPLHFDLSIFDLFVGLKSGATISLVPEAFSYFPFRLSEWIHANQITVWYSVPSILSMLLLHGKLERFTFENLRLILFAGEVFPVKYLRNLMQAIPHAQYYNLYGPTETNVITFYQVTNLAPDQIKPIPIGKPCANMAVFALDEQGDIVTTPGMEGDLYARGSCVAQGYWADSEKTNKAFITNFKQPMFEEKMYKTGDRVMLDENGNYLFLGRRDHMIKSRGYRIELGEIEAVLYNHPKIKEVAVIAISDEEIGNRIKAFVSLRDNETFEVSEIQKYCAKYLTKYMIPESFEFRNSLPKTSTGKVDKTLLIKCS
ncbi:MAG: D-alanine--poly(phosphoribitol) ligase [Ignavibacteria bacterium]|nr:D-alanine--poly(phosphoribitol) ligase [Ignavibacteria bacterium]